MATLSLVPQYLERVHKVDPWGLNIKGGQKNMYMNI
jgi:hypothetical protein